MFLKLRFTQQLRSATFVKNTQWLDISLRQTAVKGDSSRTQLVVMSFGQGNGAGGGKLQKHATTHFKRGSDAIKPYDIDAAKRSGDKTQNFAVNELDANIVRVVKQILSDNYIGGLLGSGFKLDAEKGELELRKLRVWEELITTVLVKNEVQVMRNEMWFTDGGVVEGLVDDFSLTADQRRVSFKETHSFRVGDLLKAIVEITDGGAGFRTAQYRVDKLHSNNDHHVTLRLVNGIEPTRDMVVARLGNDTDTSRQKSVYIDGLTGYIRQLGGMASFEVKAENILWHLGDTSGLAALGVDSGKYSDTLYMPSLHVTGDQLIGGRIEALDEFNCIDFSKDAADGTRFRLGDKSSFMQFVNGIFELVNVTFVSRSGTKVAPTLWRGGFSTSAQYFEGDSVSYGGSSYRCKKDAPAGTLPTNDTHWEVTAAGGGKGEDGKDGTPGQKGADGETPLIYELLPSATIVKKDAAGALSPATVNCRVALRYGNEREVIGVDPKIEFDGRNYAHDSKGVMGGRIHVVYPAIRGLIKVGDSILSQAVVTGSGGSFLISVKGHGKSEEGMWVSGVVDKKLVYHIASIDTQEQADAANAGILFNYYINSGSYTTTERMVALSSKQVDWQPAPEDYAIKLNDAAYTGTAVTPTDNLNWTLHETSGKDIDRKTTVFQEDLQAEIIGSKRDAIGAFFGGQTHIDADYFENLMRGEGAPFVVKDGVTYLSAAVIKKLWADEAFINQLTVRRLRSDSTGNPKIDINGDGNGSARIGSLNIDGSGEMTITDTNRKTVSTFSRGPVSVLDKLLEGNGSGNKPIDSGSLNFTGSLNPTLNLGGSITVPGGYTRVEISNLSLSCSIFNDFKGGRAAVSVGAMLTNGTESVYIGEVSLETYTPSDEISKNITVNTVVSVNAGGNYYVKLIGNGQSDNSLARFNGGASGGTMSYDYAKQVNESQFGRGVAVIFDARNFLYYGNNPHPENPAIANRKELIYKGHCDIPGVLAKALVGSQGQVSRKWGKNISSVQNISAGGANKRVWHEPISGEYSAFCTGYGGSDNPKVIIETLEYVDVYANGSFNIMLTGNN